MPAKKEEWFNPGFGYSAICCNGRGLGLPLLLLFVGLYLLARAYNLIPAQLSIWPPLFIALGIYLILRRFIYR